MMNKNPYGLKITDQEIEEWETKINNMTHFEMAYFWRTQPCFPVFYSGLTLFEIFDKRFRKFGGFTAEMNERVSQQLDKEMAIDETSIHSNGNAPQK